MSLPEPTRRPSSASSSVRDSPEATWDLGFAGRAAGLVRRQRLWCHRDGGSGVPAGGQRVVLQDHAWPSAPLTARRSAAGRVPWPCPRLPRPGTLSAASPVEGQGSTGALPGMVIPVGRACSVGGDSGLNNCTIAPAATTTTTTTTDHDGAASPQPCRVVGGHGPRRLL